MEEVFNILQGLGIHYELVNHKPVYTIEDMNNLDKESFKGAEICKNLFLRDQKGKRHFLVVLCSEKKANMEKIQESIENYEIGRIVEEVSTDKIVNYGRTKPKQVALLDFGAKDNIVNSLLKRGVGVTVYPSNTKVEMILATRPDGIMLSNGPGNPEDCIVEIETIKKLYKTNIPIFGICLGHQLMGLATGAKTAKLKYGHRGPNHPVKDLKTDRVYITSQNHGYYILEESLNPEIAEVTHINLNDNTVEGIKYKNKNIFTVQFHPEACPGPEDTAYLFDEFVAML